MFKDLKGFTIIEVLIALILLSGVLLFSAQALFPSIKLILTSGYRSEAAYTAQTLIEQVMSMPSYSGWANDQRITIVRNSKIVFRKVDEHLSFDISGTKVIVEVEYPDQERLVSVAGFINQ